MPLSGRTALVTGAGRGIGRAIALALASAGARVILAGRDRERLEAVAAEVAALGSPAPVVQAVDLADPAAAAGAAERLGAEVRGVDILVNNAGIAEAAPLTRTDMDMWTRHFAINATAPFLLMRAFVPPMVERRWGRVVNVASVVGLRGAAYIAAYAASKHALVGLTRAVAAETAGTGVTVNAVCPGYAATELTWNSARRISDKTGRSFDEAVAVLASANASGALVAPEAVAAAVLDLAGDGATGRSGEAVVLE